VIPRNSRVRRRPVKSLEIAVRHDTMAQSAMAEPMNHDGRIRVISMFDGIPPRI
jgi:hypothetical protein